ncbi:MAG TPA: S8 family serine peptidase, partial [Pyrinomonadaceae bacterium]|nr:S8 family serine peptidase [Pyrinomonadaceae bacterium]
MRLHRRPSRALSLLTSFSMLFSLCAGIVLSDRASAQTPRKSSEKTPASAAAPKGRAMSRYARDLTAAARRGELSHAAGISKALRRTSELLARANANPIIIDDAGATTNALVEALAIELARGDAPAALRGSRVYRLETGALLDGARTIEEFEAHLREVLAEVEAARGSVILFVDQTTTLVGANAAHGANASKMIVDALAAGTLRVVGAASSNEFDQFIAPDAKLKSLFQPVRVGSPAAESGEEDSTDAEEGGAAFAGVRVSPELQDLIEAGGSRGERARLVVQTGGADDAGLRALLASSGGRVVGSMRQLGAVQVELPVGAIRELAKLGGVRYVSLDAQVRPLGGHLTRTTGTEEVRRQHTPGDGAPFALDGTGVGIAVIDSGIDPHHVAFTDQRATKSRIAYNQDFTGEGRTDDPYGHGTHVASIAAGNARVANGTYVGIAPNANIINLRVLNSAGAGTVSATLRALDWVLANRDAYNVRVVNMSLGMPAISSYRNDPLCRAVRKLVDAGVVVVAAAGNHGENGAGQKVYGQIHAPANEPSALTVGASNTFGTDSRADDGVASYSSRGPTRSSWADAAGARHYDNLVKPDLVA